MFEISTVRREDWDFVQVMVLRSISLVVMNQQN